MVRLAIGLTAPEFPPIWVLLVISLMLAPMFILVGWWQLRQRRLREPQLQYLGHHHSKARESERAFYQRVDALRAVGVVLTDKPKQLPDGGLMAAFHVADHPERTFTLRWPITGRPMLMVDLKNMDPHLLGRVMSVLPANTRRRKK